jgi:RNA polymerase sigma factor (sigma-70 family)
MEPLALPNVPITPVETPPAAGTVAVAMPTAPTPTLAQLFETEESSLLRFALGLVGRRSVAEDLVQETFLRLHQVWDQVENPRAWLFRSLRNLALNHLRDHRAETNLDDDAGGLEQDDPPDDALGRAEAIGTVRLLLAELPDEDRRLIQFKYRDGLKYQEISRRTGVSVGNVGYKLHHLLKNLADALRRAGIEGSRG